MPMWLENALKSWTSLEAGATKASPIVKRIIPRGSLNRLSPTRVPDMFSLTLILLNIGIRLAGSVGEIIAPKINPIMSGAPVSAEKSRAAITAVMVIPSVSSMAMGKNCLLRTLKSMWWLQIPRM